MAKSCKMNKSEKRSIIVFIFNVVVLIIWFMVNSMPSRYKIDTKYIVQKQDSLIAVNNGKQAIYIEQQNRLNDELTERLKHRKTSIKTIREYVYLHSFDTS